MMKTKIALIAVSAGSLFVFSLFAENTNKVDQNKILTIKTNNQPVANTNANTAMNSNSRISSFKSMQVQMERMKQQMNRVIDDPFIDNFYSSKNPIFNSNIALPSKYPQVEFGKTDTDYLLSLIIPGMKKKDLSVIVNNNIITVSGKNSTETKKEKYKKIISDSMSTSQFTQSFTLPNDADTNKILSTYKNGVLSIKIHINKENVNQQVKIITIN